MIRRRSPEGAVYEATAMREHAASLARRAGMIAGWIA